MADISAIGASSRSAASRPSAFSALGAEDFVKIIFTELGNQDPLQPSDSKALLEQLSSLRSIQSDLDLSQRMQSLVMQNELSSASGLIGRSVSGVSEQRERVRDVVASVSRTADGAVLNLRGGQRVQMKDVDQVFEGATP
jgi:flagellar basal-body rod modification protein FlgD